MDADVVAAILVLLPEELGTFDINDVASHKKFIERYVTMKYLLLPVSMSALFCKI